MPKRDTIRFTDSDEDDRHASDLESLYASDEDYLVDTDWHGKSRIYIRTDYLDRLKDEVVTQLALSRIRERHEKAAPNA